MLKTEWGVAKFIDRSTFYDSSNGYLMDDTCVFGVEVFIVKSTNRGDCLSMFQGPVGCSYTWKFSNFSKSTLDKYESATFVGGNYKWYYIKMLSTFSTCSVCNLRRVLFGKFCFVFCFILGSCVYTRMEWGRERATVYHYF